MWIFFEYVFDCLCAAKYSQKLTAKLITGKSFSSRQVYIVCLVLCAIVVVVAAVAFSLLVGVVQTSSNSNIIPLWNTHIVV